MPVAPTTPIRIALVIHSLQGGGAERLMCQLASRWAAADHEIHLVTLASVDADMHASLPIDARIRRHGLGLMKQSRNQLDGLLANFNRVRAVKRQLKLIQPDFVLSFCDRMNIVVATSARSLACPVWIAEHSDPRKQNLGIVWEYWRGITYGSATGCVVLTPSIGQWMCQRFPKLSIEVIPPAIDPPKHGPVAEASSGQKILLAIGRLSQEKNQGALIHAWHRLASRFPDWKLVLAGDGPERARLQALTRSLYLDDRIEFLGWVNDPWKVIRLSDLVVLPSLYEGFPIVLLEAMHAGKACVSTPSCDTVVHFETSNSIVLASSYQPQDIAAAIEKLLSNPVRRAELGANGQRIAGDYCWTRIGPLWDNLLSSSVGAELHAKRQ